MWPRHLDLTPAECVAALRNLELDAYSCVVSALRAQGDLTKERRKILSDLSTALNIPVERHKAEVRRAINDERLGTIAKCLAGPNCENDWAREGRRIIPLLRRAVPVTPNTATADSVSSEVARHNRALKTPVDTRTPRAAFHKTPGENGPVPLKDILSEKDGVAKVKQPSVATPARGGKWGLPKLPNDLGDVVILPSGLAVRFREEPANEINSSKGDKSASEESDAVAKMATPKKNRRKRKGHQPDPVEDVRGSYEVMPPGMLFPQHPPNAGMFPGGGNPRSPMPYAHYNAMGPPPPPRASATTSGTPRASHPPAKRRRASKAKAAASAKNPASVPVSSPSSSTMHGYARPFLPKSPKPLHELDTPDATTVSTSGSTVQQDSVPTSSGGSIVQPQLPRVPVSPQKISEAIQRAAAGGRRDSSSGRPSKSPLTTASASDVAAKTNVVKSEILSSTATPLVAGAPIYMVASPATSSASGATGIPAGVRVLTTAAAASSTGQRVVTVSTAALRAAQQAGGVPGQKTTTVYRTLSAPGGIAQRTFLAATGNPGGTPGTSRPSVIVVQRTPISTKTLAGGAGLGATAGIFSPGTTSQRILTKSGKPLVIVSKPIASAVNLAGGTAATGATVGSPHILLPATPSEEGVAVSLSSDVSQNVEQENQINVPESGTAPPQDNRNVLVLGVNQESEKSSSNVLSDILQATGILQQQENQAAMDVEMTTADTPNSTEEASQKMEEPGTVTDSSSVAITKDDVKQGVDNGAGTVIVEPNHQQHESNSLTNDVETLDATIGSSSNDIEARQLEASQQNHGHETTYLKTKPRAGRSETVLPPCADPSEVMPVSVVVSQSEQPSSSSAVSSKESSSENGSSLGEKDVGESLEDISSFIRQSSLHMSSK